ncbi:hypothetical protein PHYBOEH_005603 [Phytophthora boehmeriae]|uniref:GPI inositol-deacylase n=1 Tax=Phytophthora boehmeriae TaxID=109152 RepID=A0A8T1WP76_9STRA|nr:hypothetical protein PHYBOEH_005603 [Phytophthora boehmeriae]
MKSWIPHLLAIATVAFSAPTASAGKSTVHGDLLASTTDWPSLQLQFKVKRNSMKIHGTSEFDVFANPVVSADGVDVRYDGFAEFTQDSTLHRYTLVDGVAYYSSSAAADQDQADQTSSSTVQCLESDSLPPLHDIISALNDATLASNVTTPDGAITCSAGNFFRISFGGGTYALCASGSSGVDIYGSDLDIAIKYLNKTVGISAPKMNAGAKSECETIVNPTSVTATTVALLTGEPTPESESRGFFGISISLTTPTCSCKSTPRPCVFIHGLGIDYEEEELQDSFSYYWGNMTEHAPCCTSFKYAIMDTVNNAWTNATQQQKVCNHALAVSESSTKSVVADTIIITHSMGGLTLAGAIANGTCSLDKSTSWVATSAPMKGSMGSDFSQDSCDGENGGFMDSLADLLGQCPTNASVLSLAYENGNNSSPELNDAYVAAQQAYQTNVTAALCSDDYSGLVSIYQATYWAGGHLIPHNSPENDGMVEFQSCAGGLPMSDFGSNYRDKFYVTHLNHADTTFYNGDALFKVYKKPVKWFECLL